MRNAMQTYSPLRARLIALLGVAGLFASWSHSLAHDHTLGNTAGDEPGRAVACGDGFQVSSDDSHHEHSSRTALEIEACLACRSGSQDDADCGLTTRLASDLGLEGGLPTARTESWQRVPRHAHSPRAPPAQPTPIV